MKRAFVIAPLALILACSRPARTTAPPPPAGKPTAPVHVEATLTERSAHVVVHFDAPATDVSVEVSGTDGLAVTSAGRPVEAAALPAPDTTVFDVTFVPGPGRSHLAIAVGGKFEGQRLRRTVSFPVGHAAPEPAAGTVQTMGDGERLKVLPARRP